MLELAPRTIGTIEIFMEPLAKLRLVVLRYIRLRVQLLYSMSE